MADSLKQEGVALFSRGEYAEALARFELAATHYEESGDRAARAEMYNNIGVIHRLQRNWPAALATLSEAEKSFAALGDGQRQAQVLGNLGDLYAARRDREKAARYYSDAAELFAQSSQNGNSDFHWQQSQVLRALSLLRLRQMRWFEAIVHMEQSLAVNPQPSFAQRLFRALIRFALQLFSGGRAF